MGSCGGVCRIAVGPAGGRLCPSVDQALFITWFCLFNISPGPCYTPPPTSVSPRCPRAQHALHNETPYKHRECRLSRPVQLMTRLGHLQPANTPHKAHHHLLLSLLGKCLIESFQFPAFASSPSCYAGTNCPVPGGLPLSRSTHRNHSSSRSTSCAMQHHNFRQ